MYIYLHRSFRWNEELLSIIYFLAGKYACSSGNQCVARLNVCDGIQHCRDGSDESQCLRNKKRRRKNKHNFRHLKHATHHVTPLSLYKEQRHKPQGNLSDTMPYYTVEGGSPSEQEYYKELTTTPSLSKKFFTNPSDVFENTPNLFGNTESYTRHYDERSTSDIDKEYSNVLFSGGGQSDVVSDKETARNLNIDVRSKRKNKNKESKYLPTTGTSPIWKYDTTLGVTSKVTRSTRLLNLKVYPPNQEVYETGDVVVQCRDEGSLRVDVYWEKAASKENVEGILGAQSRLPRSAVDHNGRLEISRILMHEGGLYVCKALNHENDIGGKADANVRVLRLP